MTIVSIVAVTAILTKAILVVTNWYDYEPVITQEQEDYCEFR